jgi:small conductance mechanosensitive channel
MNYDPLQILYYSINQLIVQVVEVLPKIILAIVIWYIGRYLIGLAAKLIRKADLPGTFDDNAREILARTVNIVGRILLVLIVLDFLGIGETVVGALTQGLVFAVAIALGIAFGDALKPEAMRIVKDAQKQLKK